MSPSPRARIAKRVLDAGLRVKPVDPDVTGRFSLALPPGAVEEFLRKVPRELGKMRLSGLPRPAIPAASARQSSGSCGNKPARNLCGLPSVRIAGRR